MNRKKDTTGRTTLTTGISLDPAVLNFVDQIAAEQERSRSKVINLIIRQYAATHGTPISEDLFGRARLTSKAATP